MDNQTREIVRAAKAARKLNKQGLRLISPDGTFADQKIRSAHYHVMYDLVVHTGAWYETERLALIEVKRLGDAAEPNTVWYDEGPVLIETRLYERTGLHRVLLQVVPCFLERCKASAGEIYEVPAIQTQET